MGWPDISALVGTQAYFVFDQADLGVRPRFNRIQDEWQRIYRLSVQYTAVSTEFQLNEQIAASLDDRLPVCLPLDIFWLPYTPHYQRLKQIHFVNIFGYDRGKYYIVCPYYRYMGWLDAAHIHTAFFASSSGLSRNIISIPYQEAVALSEEQVYRLVQESCQNMLGLTIPEALAEMDPQHLGLVGISTFASCLQEALSPQRLPMLTGELLDLSRHLMSIGNSRYWFYKLIEPYNQSLFYLNGMPNPQEQFETVTRSWRGIGRMLGTIVHTGKSEKAAWISRCVKEISADESKLFSNLLGALPGYEAGYL